MNNGRLKNFLKKIKLNESTISVILGAVVVIVIGALIFNYFRGVGKIKTEEGQPTQTIGEVKLIEEEGELMPEGLPITYKVQTGDNLWKIAEKFYSSGYNWVDIAKENNLINANRLLVDQELVLPKVAVRQPVEKIAEQQIAGDEYMVVKGDNLWNIAVRAYQDGYQWVKIAHENNLANPNLIHPGNVLKLPR
ncbi:LysM peptidoglycan-binding domain-containing protein [Patescibacteria group bacterium]|nr:LysM peptidoglycan-binding domain-containing protein [Patescibacteria group bacterium]